MQYLFTMYPPLKAEPLPIISVLLESVDGNGRCAPICANPDFDSAETALLEWLGKQAERWPGGIVPVRVRVAFPRRLVFAYEFQADQLGFMEAGASPGFAARRATSALVTLRERLTQAMEEALGNDDMTVEAIAANRVARIVLPYGNPAPMGN